MSWAAVARKDFQDAARSKLLWGVLALFVLFAGGLALLYTELLSRLGGGVESGTDSITMGFVLLMSGNFLFGAGPVLVLVPVIGLLLGYKSVAGERDSGQMKILLGLPHSRSDVVVGKLVGRTGVGLLGVVAGFTIAALLVAILESLSPLMFFQFVIAVAVFLFVHISIGVGISAAAPSSTWSIVAVFLFIGFFQVIWGAMFFVVKVVVWDLTTEAPEWFQFLRTLSPGRAYDGLLATIVPRYSELKADLTPGGATDPSTAEPFFAQDWFGLVVLLVWAVVPLALGYLRFDTVDLS